MRLLCCLLLLLAGCQLACAVIRVGAWNIQDFSNLKANNPNIVHCIAEVVRRYDIMVLQEVLADNDVLRDLRNSMGANNYNYLASRPLGFKGTGTRREKYVYFYNTNTVTLVDNYHYEQPRVRPIFDRPPFIAMFRSRAPNGYAFALIPLHSRPQDAVQEIDALVDVLADVNTDINWNVQRNTLQNRVLLLGDFNAGTNYVPATSWATIRLRPLLYPFLIGGNVRTMVATNQAHDRIVATNAMANHVVQTQPGTYAARAYRYQCPRGPGITPSQPAQVSDHYPVEVELQ